MTHVSYCNYDNLKFYVGFLWGAGFENTKSHAKEFFACDS